MWTIMELFQDYSNRQKTKVFSFILCLSLFFCLTTFSSCNNISSFVKFGQDYIADNMLVMVYVSGSNSLRNEIIWDLNSMEKGLFIAKSNGFTKLKVVALVDKDSSVGGESWTGTRLYEVTPFFNELSTNKIHSQIIETASNSLGEWRTSADQEEDMGNIKTLENFILWATETYTDYQKHSLILWNHGGGVYSDYKPNYFICTDDESGRTSDSLDNVLYVGEISELLEKYYTKKKSLEFLGFDACFMGMFEVAYQFRNSVKYMTFSPATEFGGWNYEYIFSQPDSCLSGKNFAINAVDGYKVAYNSAYPNTMTAVDLQFASELKEKIDILSERLGEEFSSDKTSMREKMERVKNNSILMHQKDDNNLNSLLLCYPYYELGSLLRCFSNENLTLKNDNGVKFLTSTASAAFQTQDVLEKMILKTWLGGEYGNAYRDSEKLADNTIVFTENIPYGISIFFSNKNNFYHHRFYTSEKTGSSGVFGYGCIEAANKTDNGKIDTWYELQCALYE